jgi:eukaryotic-like serine/threonine-protein kinase
MHHTAIEQWPAVSKLLDEALDLPVETRRAWLDALDPRYAALKPVLEALLANQTQLEHSALIAPGGEVLRSDVSGSAHDDSFAPGQRIGSYQLLREIGRGGMARVWLADRADGTFERQVALKLPYTQHVRGDLMARFMRERVILATLEHQNIARLYDAGVADDGMPYLAMEYVDGLPITDYADTQHLKTAARLQLFLQVIDAVQFAHERLIIHRDLKPNNILVTRTGDVRLLDFGIAKLLGQNFSTRETALTQEVGRSLTLDYASPEQVRGEPLTTASDVYSLGVILYELLTGERPYRLQLTTPAQLEQAIVGVEPTTPSSRIMLEATKATRDDAKQRAKTVSGDLDTITMKALQKNSALRYTSASELSLEIKRYLNFEPIRAKPESRWYTFKKFVRRHRIAVAGSAALAVSLVAGLAGTLWQTRAAQVQAERALRVKAFMLSIFNDADSTSEAGTSRTAADLLKLARKRVVSEPLGGEEVSMELTTAVGRSMLGHGMSADAVELMRSKIESGANELGEAHPLTRAARDVYGEALFLSGRSKDAIAALAPAISAARAAGDQRALVVTLRTLSKAQLNEGQVNEAIESAQQSVAALSVLEKSGAPLAPDVAMHAHHAYANALSYAQRPGAADAARAALAAARKVYGERITQPLISLQTLLAVSLIREGQLDEGLRTLDTLLPATISLLGSNHPQVAVAANFSGNARLTAGDIRGGIRDMTLSTTVADKLAADSGRFHRGIYHQALGGAYARARQPADALRELDVAIELLITETGSNRPTTQLARSVRAAQLAELGRLTEAEAEFAALDSVQWVDAWRAAHLNRVAKFRAAQGRYDEALDVAQRAAEAVKKVGSKEPQALILGSVGAAQLDTGHAQQAINLLQQSAALFKGIQIGLSPDSADVHLALGRAHLALGNAGAAVESIIVADRFWQSFDAKNRYAGLTKLYLAQAFAANGDTRASAEALQGADSVLTRTALDADRAILQRVKRAIGR